MRKLRFHLTALALLAFAGGFSFQSASAQQSPHQHQEAGHDHAAMQKERAEQEQEIAGNLAKLNPQDQKQATEQRFCPIMKYNRLGAEGAPLKVMIGNQAVFVCCKGCVADAKQNGQETLKTAQELTRASATLKKLPADERAAIEAQKFCAVQNKHLLGAMGTPIKLELNGQPVYLCCAGCKKTAQANPAATIAKVEELKKAGKMEGHDHEDHDHK